MENLRVSPNREVDLSDIQAAQEGDREAFGRLYARYAQKLAKFTYRQTGSWEDSEDIVADSFIKAMTHLESYKPEYSFYSWLARIAVNTRYDLQRRKKTGYLPEDFDVKDTSDYTQPEQNFDRKESLSRVGSLLNLIPSPQARRIVIFRYLEEKSVPETAQLLNVAPGTIKSVSFRTLHGLREKVNTNK